MIRVGIYGGSGYTGLELMRILLRHPDVKVTALTSRKFKGQPLSDTYPLFEGLTDIQFIDASPEQLAVGCRRDLPGHATRGGHGHCSAVS